MENDKTELYNIIQNALIAMPEDLVKVGDYYVRKDQLDRYNELAAELYLPGTSILKPREREANETDQEYEVFLKNYYSIVFPKGEKTEGNSIKPMPPLEEVKQSEEANIESIIPKESINIDTIGENITNELPHVDNIEFSVNNVTTPVENVVKEEVIPDVSVESLPKEASSIKSDFVLDEDFQVMDVSEYKESKPTLRQKIKNSIFLEKAIGWVFNYVDAIKKDVREVAEQLDEYELEDKKLDTIEDEEIVDTHDINSDLDSALFGVEEESVIENENNIDNVEVTDVHDADFDVEEIIKEISNENSKELSKEEQAVNEVLEQQEQEFKSSSDENINVDDLLEGVEESTTIEPLTVDRKPVIREYVNVGMETTNLPLSDVHPLAISGEIEDLESEDLNNLMNNIRNNTGEEYNYSDNNKHQMETLDDYVLIDDQDELVISNMYYIGKNNNLNIINNTYGFDDLENVIIGLSDKDEVARGTVAYISASALKNAIENKKNNVQNNDVGFSK